MAPPLALGPNEAASYSEEPSMPLPDLDGTLSIYLPTHLRLNYRMEDISPGEQENLESYGWFSHFVVGETEGQKWVNYHTHGLPDHYGHLDFQFVLPIDSHTLHALATRLVDRVKKGERFVPGMRVSGLMNKHEALLIQTMETRSIQRSVLRVILPDKEGNLDRATLKGIFAAQFQELPD